MTFVIGEIYNICVISILSKNKQKRLRGYIMNAIKSVQDFKEFLETNHDLLYSNAVKADDITEDDEWMQGDEWDKIYSVLESGSR